MLIVVYINITNLGALVTRIQVTDVSIFIDLTILHSRHFS